jgi:hypothetical protein
MTISKMTLRVKRLSIMDLTATLSINGSQYYGLNFNTQHEC